VKPLETYMVADLNVFHEFSSCYYHTCTFVASYQRHLRSKWPVTIYSVKVCMTNSTVFDVDEDFI